MKLLFVCHGNICRSPMAEFVMKDLLEKAGRHDVVVESAALHTDELGHDIHRGTRRELDRHSIPHTPRAAWLMDGYNMADLRRLVFPDDRSKLRKLLTYAGLDRDVADPWYTGNFEETYADVILGCTRLLESIEKEETK